MFAKCKIDVKTLTACTESGRRLVIRVVRHIITVELDDIMIFYENNSLCEKNSQSITWNFNGVLCDYEHFLSIKRNQFDITSVGGLVAKISVTRLKKAIK